MQSDFFHRNKRLGRLILFSTWAAGLLVFSASAFRWLTPNPFHWFPPTLSLDGIENQITPRVRLMGLAIEFIPIAGQLMILAPLQKLGHLLMKGDLLIRGMNVHIRSIGNGLMLFAVTSGLYEMALYTFTEHMRTPDVLKIHLGLSSSFFYLMISGFVIQILSHATSEGEIMKEEISQII